MHMKGHTKAVDWWSMGCVVYETLFGYPPFFTGKALETYKKVLDPSCLIFPDSFSGLAKDLLGGLLKVGSISRVDCVSLIQVG